MESQNGRRIGVGGFLMASYLQRLLQLRWPSAAAAITLSRAEVRGGHGPDTGHSAFTGDTDGVQSVTGERPMTQCDVVYGIR